MAHGDLASDNCLVQGSDIKLIDYDGCFIPALAASFPGEAGNQHFQHPGRIGYYAANMDAFPSLVIYLSLIALDADKSLWQFHTGDNLIFAAKDYLSPRASPLWQALAESPDARIRSLTSALADMCRAPISTLPPLGQVVTGTPTSNGQQHLWWQTWRAPSQTGKAVPGARRQQPWWRSASLPVQPGGSTPAQPAQPAQPAAPPATSWLQDQLQGGRPRGPWAPPPWRPPAPVMSATARSSAAGTTRGSTQRAGQPQQRWYGPAPGSCPGTPSVSNAQPAARYRRRHWQRAVAWLAIVAAVLALLGIWLLTSGAAASPRGPHRFRAPSVARQLTFTQLQVGDCLRGSDLRLNTDDPWPYPVSAVPCNETHTAEIFYVAYWPEKMSFPGGKVITNQGTAICDAKFRAYVGIAPSKSALTWMGVAPVSSSAWDSGYRALVCVAFKPTNSQPAGAPLDGSIKGSRQ
jgi:Septum formation